MPVPPPPRPRPLCRARRCSTTTAVRRHAQGGCRAQLGKRVRQLTRSRVGTQQQRQRQWPSQGRHPCSAPPGFQAAARQQAAGAVRRGAAAAEETPAAAGMVPACHSRTVTTVGLRRWRAAEQLAAAATAAAAPGHLAGLPTPRGGACSAACCCGPGSQRPSCCCKVPTPVVVSRPAPGERCTHALQPYVSICTYLLRCWLSFLPLLTPSRRQTRPPPTPHPDPNPNPLPPTPPTLRRSCLPHGRQQQRHPGAHAAPRGD